MTDPEGWCESTEEEPNETYQEEETIEVQADYIPDRWNG